MATREIWQSLPADPASDYGLNRRITTYTDSKEASWIDGWWKPPWVEAEFSASRHWNLVHAHRVVVTPILQEKHAAQSAHSIRVTGSDGSFGSLCSGAFSNFNSERQLNDRRQSPDSVEVQGVQVSSNKFFGLVQKCIRENNEAAGRKVHYLIVKNGLESDAFLGTFVIRMFVLFGSLSEANEVFRKLSNPNVFSWNAIISAHLKFGQNDQAIQLYLEMKNSNIEPSGHVYVSVLKACSGIAALEQGRQIHTDIIGTGFESDVFVGSTVIDMYAKCGRLDEACIVFGRLPTRNVVTWSTLISGYAQHFHAEKALQLFKQMQQEGMQPNQVTFVLLLKACSSIADQEQGKWIHEHIIESGLEVDQFVGSTLVDMYAKCGNLEEAVQVFKELPKRNVVSWCAMITGYVQHGHYGLALQCLEDLENQGLKLDGNVYTGILAALSHTGQVEEGHNYFRSMREEHGITPCMEHFNCMVDLLGRAGLLSEAEDIIKKMPMAPDSMIWISLLGACRKSGNVNLGERCFEQVVCVDPDNAVSYVLMSNIYADAHMWEEVQQIQEQRKYAYAWKKPGKAWMEVSNKVHEFIVGDKTHSHSGLINAKLKRLGMLMKQEGYVPQLDIIFDCI